MTPIAGQHNLGLSPESSRPFDGRTLWREVASRKEPRTLRGNPENSAAPRRVLPLRPRLAPRGCVFGAT